MIQLIIGAEQIKFFDEEDSFFITILLKIPVWDFLIFVQNKRNLTSLAMSDITFNFGIRTSTGNCQCHKCRKIPNMNSGSGTLLPSTPTPKPPSPPSTPVESLNFKFFSCLIHFILLKDNLWWLMIYL